MDTKDLKYFTKVYEMKSINKAAAMLYISTQGLSKVISKIENELNTLLFIRAHTGVTPTKAGDNLYYRSRGIMEQLSYISSELQIHKEKTLEIPCTPGFMRLCGMDFVLGFKRAHPDINLRIYEKIDVAMDKQLWNEDVEIAIMSNPVDPMKYEAAGPLAVCPLVAVVNKSNPLAQNDEILLSDLSDEPLVTSCSYDFCAYLDRFNVLATTGIKLNFIFQAIDLDYLVQIASKNQAIALTGDFPDSASKYNNVKVIPVKNPDQSWMYSWEIVIAQKRGKTISPEAECFKRYILEWTKTSKY